MFRTDCRLASPIDISPRQGRRQTHSIKIASCETRMGSSIALGNFIGMSCNRNQGSVRHSETLLRTRPICAGGRRFRQLSTFDCGQPFFLPPTIPPPLSASKTEREREREGVGEGDRRRRPLCRWYQ